MKQLYYIVRREIMVKFKSRSFYLFALVTPILFMLPVIFQSFRGHRIQLQLSKGTLWVSLATISLMTP